MPSVLDVAVYILEKKGFTTAMKLQKLVYYSQVWSVVWDGEPLFNERIEAWINGPIVPVLYQVHEGKFKIFPSNIEVNSNLLSEKQRDTIDKVLDFYGERSSQWLSDLTHIETPWISARKGLLPNERGNKEITLSSIEEYYSSL